jgi:signal transduction histidine kinase
MIIKQVIIIVNYNRKYDAMPKQVSALNTVLIVQYIDKNYPEILMQDIVNEANRTNIYFVENLKTGKVGPVSIKHLSNVQYWFSNLFMMDLYAALEKAIPDSELALKIGRTSYKSQHFFKTAIGIPVLGTYRLLERISEENRKYNRTKDINIVKCTKKFVIIKIVHKQNIIINEFAMKWHVGVFESYAMLAGATNINISVECVDKGPQKYGDPGNGIWEFNIRFTDHSLLKRFFNSFLYRIQMVRDLIDNANKIQEDHNEQILFRENIIRERTDKLKKIQNKLFEEERKNINEKLKNISNELIVTEERERHLLAEDLHDSVSQSLAISLSKIKTVIESKKYKNNPFEELIDIKDFVEQAISDMRSVTFQICPPILYDLGLEAALKWLIADINRQNDMKIDFINNIQTPINTIENIKIFMYRSVRELIINIIKHARTQQAKVTLTINKHQLLASVQDNGIGFDINKINNNNSMSFGLFSISERFKAIGGNIEIFSKLQKGTKILLMIPLTEKD